MEIENEKTSTDYVDNPDMNDNGFIVDHETADFEPQENYYLNEVDFYTEKIIEKYGKEPETDESAILKKWNWGAFALPVIWGLCNGVVWPLAFGFLLLWLKIITIGNANMAVIYDLIALVVAVVIRIILGIKGNREAWEYHKDTMDFSKFVSLQRKWNIAGVIIVVFQILLVIYGIMHRGL